LQPSLRYRELKGLIEKDHNCKATLYMCTRVRVGPLTTIIGDYKDHFGQIKDYLYEVYKQNLRTTVKVKTANDTDD